MNLSTNLFVSLQGAMYSLPFLLMWAGGLAMAVYSRARHPRVALLSGLGCGVMLLTELAYIAFMLVINLSEQWWLFGVVDLTSSVVSAVGLALLVAAALSGRGGDV